MVDRCKLCNAVITGNGRGTPLPPGHADFAPAKWKNPAGAALCAGRRGRVEADKIKRAVFQSSAEGSHNRTANAKPPPSAGELFLGGIALLGVVWLLEIVKSLLIPGATVLPGRHTIHGNEF